MQRTTDEIYIDILEYIILYPATPKTKLAQKCNLKYVTVNKRILFLKENNLIKGMKKHFITKKGLEYFVQHKRMINVWLNEQRKK